MLALHQMLAAAIEAHGIRAVLSAIAGICEERAERMDARTPGNHAAEYWARLAVRLDIAAGEAAAKKRPPTEANRRQA